MTFLAINGWPVPVDTISEDLVESAEPARAFAGSIHPRRRALKRKWTVKTRLMAGADAEVLRQMLAWTGHYWPFDADLFSTKGLGPASGNYAPLLYGTDQGGASIIGQAIYGNAIVPGPATINALNSATSLTNDISQWAAGSNTYLGTSSSLTSGAVTSSSIGMVALGAGTMSMTNTTGTSFTGAAAAASVYIKVVAGSAASATLSLQPASGPTVTSAPVNLAIAPGAYQRLSVIVPNTMSSTYKLVVNVAGVSGNCVIGVNGAQLEAAPYPTPWQPGGVTRAASRALYTLPPEELRNATAITLMAWVNGSLTVPAYSQVARELWFLSDASGRHTLAFYVPGNDADLWFLSADNGNANQMSYGSALAGGLHHVAVVCNFYPTGAPYLAQVYVDGVAINEAYLYLPKNFTLAQMVTLDVGSANGSGFFQGAIDDMLMLPYAASPGLIASIAANTVAYGPQPRLACSGTFADGDSPQCLSSTVKLNNSGFDLGDGTWQRTGGTVTFCLLEV